MFHCVHGCLLFMQSVYYFIAVFIDNNSYIVNINRKIIIVIILAIVIIMI